MADAMTLDSRFVPPPADPSALLAPRVVAAPEQAESIPSWKPWVWALILLAVSLAVAPLLYFRADMEICSLPWARASGGSRAWDMYQVANCNYPPFLLYMITAAERMRMILHGSPGGGLMVTLVKLGGILADVAGVLVCAIGLRKPFGTRAAVAAAGAFALAVPLWIDSAVWGQFDVIIVLTFLLTVIAALHRRPFWCGAAAGWAIMIKLQAIMIAPAVAIYLWRRMGPASIVKATAGMVIVIALLTGPFLLHGQAKKVWACYTSASVDLFPRRSMTAANTWYLLDGFDIQVRHIPERVARYDGRKAVGPLTFKQVGLVLLAADFLFLCTVFYRHPLDRLFPFAAAMGVFGFFMLCTQMHGRYIVLGIGLLATLWRVAPRTRVIFVGLVITAALNETITFLRDNLRGTPAGLPHRIDVFTAAVAGVLALINVVLFVTAHVRYWQEARDPRPE